MYILNSEDLCLYNLLCDSSEILIQCFTNFTNAFDFMRQNQI